MSRRIELPGAEELFADPTPSVPPGRERGRGGSRPPGRRRTAAGRSGDEAAGIVETSPTARRRRRGGAAAPSGGGGGDTEEAAAERLLRRVVGVEERLGDLSLDGLLTLRDGLDDLLAAPHPDLAAVERLLAEVAGGAVR